MRSLHQGLALLALSLAASAQAQLVIPTGLPSVAANFKLRAHATTENSTLGAKIENWVLGTAGYFPCNQFSGLSSDDRAAQHFFVNLESHTIQSKHDNKTQKLTLEKNHRGQKVLKLECGEEALSELTIRFENSVPLLALQRDKDSQFYACQDRKSDDVDVFYREKHNEPLPAECTDINLVLECMSGRGHGLIELAACCRKVHNGKCLRK